MSKTYVTYKVSFTAEIEGTEYDYTCYIGALRELSAEALEKHLYEEVLAILHGANPPALNPKITHYGEV